MYLEEIGDALVRVNLVLHSREAVALVFVNLQLNRATTLLHGISHLSRLFRRTARIVAAGQQQQRGLDLVHEVDG